MTSPLTPALYEGFLLKIQHSVFRLCIQSYLPAELAVLETLQASLCLETFLLGLAFLSHALKGRRNKTKTEFVLII